MCNRLTRWHPPKLLWCCTHQSRWLACSGRSSHATKVNIARNNCHNCMSIMTITVLVLHSINPGTRLRTSLWAKYLNLVKICVALMSMILRTMIRLVHILAHVTTCELSWHVQNCDLIGSLELQLEQNEHEWGFSYELLNCLQNAPLVTHKFGAISLDLRTTHFPLLRQIWGCVALQYFPIIRQ